MRKSSTIWKVSESKIQQAIVAFLETVMPENSKFFHPANGTKRSIGQAAKLKREGLVSGIPDLCFYLVRNGVIVPAFIEVKTPTGTLSAEQRKFRDWCMQFNIPWAVARSVTDAQTILLDWGVIGREQCF